MRFVAFVLVIALAGGCGDGLAPESNLPVAMSARTVGGDGSPVQVSGGLGSVVVDGGPGLTCGIASASGRASLLDARLTIVITLRPLGSCPFAPVAGRYTAIVSNVPGGVYEVEVQQHYQSSQSDVIVEGRVEVGES